MSEANAGPDDPLIGRTLGGRYRVERLLGRGSMGAVYEATQIDLARSVAIKAITGDVDERALARLHDEALTAAALTQPNVVNVFEMCPARGSDPPFLVMELLRGESLATALKGRGRLAPAVATAVASQMLLALEAAHAAKILHRDVKPANVVVVGDLDRAPMIKLVDFGLAKFADDGASPRTTTGKVIGTLGYLAPERLAGAPAAEAADLYAVGVCLYEMLTGKRPFDAKRPDFVEAILTEKAPDPRDLAPEVSAPVAEVTLRALAKTPEERYPSARAMFGALEQATRSVAPAAAAAPLPPPDAPARLGRGVLFALALTSSVAIGAIAIAAIVVAAGPPSRAPAHASASASASAIPDARVHAEASGQPPADATPRPTAAAPIPPSASASAAKPTARTNTCICRDSFGGARLCTRPQPPVCECAGLCTPMCSVPYVKEGTKERCPGDERRVMAGAQKGDACEGYCKVWRRGGAFIPPEEAKRESGKLRCDVCSKPDRVSGQHGAPCQGVDYYGNPRTGKLDCR